MRTLSAIVPWMLCAGVVLWSQEARSQDPPPTFRARTDTVVVHATVRDRNGRLVTDVKRDAFRVTDNGRPVDIVAFANDPQPITGVMFVQGQMTSLPRDRAVAEAFVSALGDQDRFAIGSAGSFEVGISPHLTSDQRLLRRVVNEEIWPMGPSPGIAALLFDRAEARLEKEAGRKAIVFLTFRCVGSTCAGMGSYIARLRDAGVVVYCIEVDAPSCGVGLRSFVDDTGGGHVRVDEKTDLAVVFAEVMNELRHQYVLGIAADPNGSAAHRIQVRVSGSGLTATATKQYRIPTGP